MANQAWFMYPGQTFMSGDAAIGGEHGQDFSTPPNTPVTNIVGPATITSISDDDGYGQGVTYRLDSPYHGSVPYAYNIHLAAVNPNLRVGSRITNGDLLGWSGGGVNDSQYLGTSNPTGQNYLDSTQYSSGPHTEFGFTYGPQYGTGAGFGYTLADHPELNPADAISLARANQAGEASGGLPASDQLAILQARAGLNPQADVTTIGTPFGNVQIPGLHNLAFRIALFMIYLLMIGLGLYVVLAPEVSQDAQAAGEFAEKNPEVFA